MPLSRRSFLVGAVGLAMASCGEPGEPSTQTATTSTTTPGRYSLVALFDGSGGEVSVGIPQRLPFAIGNRAGVLVADSLGPATFVVEVDGETGGAPRTVAPRSDGLNQPYYPIRFTPQRAGLHRVTMTVGSDVASAAFVVSTSPPAVSPGAPMLDVDTPTVRNHRGVEPICTRRPRCPFHELSLTHALAERRPVALLVASPGHCDATLCPPALDLVIAAASRFPAVRFVHAEVYTDADEVDSLADATTTDAVRTYGLRFEPSLLLARADGTLAERLDHIFDASELDEALTRLSR